MRGDALQQREGVAHPVGLVGSQHRRVDGRVDVDYLLRFGVKIFMWSQKIFVASTNLEQRGHGAEAVPQHGAEVTHHLPLLAQLQQRRLPSLGAGELEDPYVDLLPVHIGASPALSSPRTRGGAGGRGDGRGGRGSLQKYILLKEKNICFKKYLLPSW